MNPSHVGVLSSGTSSDKPLILRNVCLTTENQNGMRAVKLLTHVENSFRCCFMLMEDF